MRAGIGYDVDWRRVHELLLAAAEHTRHVTSKPAPAVWYHLFAEAPPAIRAEAEVELAAAGDLYFDRSVDIVEVPEMEPLGAGGGRSAAHPLDGRVHRARG